MPEDNINIDRAINLLFTKVQKNPYLVYSESDLQTLLGKEILSIDETVYPIKDQTGGTYRVHTEYPYTVNAHDFDIVVFAESDIKNINGALFIFGQNPDGSDELLNGKDEIKRSVFCSHLIELKIRDKNKGTLKSSEIEQDFEYLRKGFELYEHFRILYEIETQLYFVCYLNWNPGSERTIKKQVEIFKKIFNKAKHHPPINFYLLIGPRERWEEKFHTDEFLYAYTTPSTKRIYFFDND